MTVFVDAKDVIALAILAAAALALAGYVGFVVIRARLRRWRRDRAAALAAREAIG